MKKLLFLILIVFLFSCKKDTEQPVDPASNVFCWLCNQHVIISTSSWTGGCSSGATGYDVPSIVCNMTENGASEYAHKLDSYASQSSGGCLTVTKKTGKCTKQGK